MPAPGAFRIGEEEKREVADGLSVLAEVDESLALDPEDVEYGTLLVAVFGININSTDDAIGQCADEFRRACGA